MELIETVSFNNQPNKKSEFQYGHNIVKLNRGGEILGGLGRAGQPSGPCATLFWALSRPDPGLGSGLSAWRRRKERESHTAERT